MELDEAYDDLIRLFANTSDEEEMKHLFEDMFTDAEQKDFTIRWKLMNDLYQHKSQRDIAKELKISLCRITRGSKMLKKKDGFIRKVLQQRYSDHYQI